MAAAKLYEVGHLSQERAAELLGLDRQGFQLALSQMCVPPFQGVDEDLAAL
jgi:predicted HTH domain antitoxin